MLHLFLIIIVIVCYIIITFLHISHNRYEHKILIGILSIDRDYKHIERQYEQLKGYHSNGIEIIVITRISDINTIKSWESRNVKVLKVDHYEIESENRHNYKMIAYKRNTIIQYAKINNFDYLWFLDSDIIPGRKTLDEMLTQKDSDVVNIPSNLTWNPRDPVGFIDGGIREYETNLLSHIFDVDIVGMGCTLIKKSCFDISFEITAIKQSHEDEDIIIGEDIDFCFKLKSLGKRVTCIPRKYSINTQIQHLI